jgi:hypothetical protein
MSSTFARLLFATFACIAVPTAVAAADTFDGRVTDYRFDDDQVFGDHPNPDGEVLRVRTRDQRESLVRARTHFIPELLKSVENL